MDESDKQAPLGAGRGPIRIFLVDDHQGVRAGIRGLLDKVEDMEVIGEASNGAEALERVAVDQPHVVITDLNMDGMDGLPTIDALKSRTPELRVVVWSMYSKPEQVRRAVRAGADAYVAKEDEFRHMVHAVRSVLQGNRYFSTSVTDWERGVGDQRLEGLTPRQREILQLIAEGHRTRQIAELLGVAAKTVDTHRTQLMQRLDIHDIAGLTRFAIEVGLVTLNEARPD
ncbi:MAG: response regulator transcription factor [Pseudomonadota bacterium]